MQFTVPQFIEVEAKIIGPISARQFIELLVTGGLTFGNINGQTMHYFLLNLVQTLKKPRLKVWRRMEYMNITEQKEIVAEPMAIKEQFSQSHLASTALMVDTGGAYASEEIRNSVQKKIKKTNFDNQRQQDIQLK